MASITDKLRYYYRLGGIRLVIRAVLEKITHSGQMPELCYEYHLKLSPEEYPEIVKLWYPGRGHITMPEYSADPTKPIHFENRRKGTYEQSIKAD